MEGCSVCWIIFMSKNIKEIVGSIDGWLFEKEIFYLYETARGSSKNGVIVEIGSWQGKSTICLAKGSQERNRVPVYAIDPHIGSSEHQKDGQKVWTFEKFKENIKRAGIEDMVFPIVKTSEDAVKEWDKPISFLWIDGAHEYEFVKKDFFLWTPFLIDGGVVAIHDVISSFSGPRRIVLEGILASDNFYDFSIKSSLFSARYSKTPRKNFFERSLWRMWVILLSFLYVFLGYRLFNISRTLLGFLGITHKK